MPKGYKILRRDRTSLITRIGSVRYGMDIETKPRKGFGPLAIFRNKTTARNFLKELSEMAQVDSIIVKCDYIESRHDYLWLLFCGEKNLLGPDLPPGTILADSVTCLE